MNGCSFGFLIQFLSWEVVMTWIRVSDVEQVLNACLLVRASIGLCLNKGLLVALQWMVPKYLRRVFRETKRYCACGLWVWCFKLEQNSNSSVLSITMGANICHLSLNITYLSFSWLFFLSSAEKSFNLCYFHLIKFIIHVFQLSSTVTI